MVDLLVTGAAGQLGWETVRRAPEMGLSVSAVARRDLDITDRGAVRELVERLKPRVILNAAAYTAVDKAEEERDAAFAVNAEAPGHLAEVATETGAAIIHISTDYVFDGAKDGAWTEDDPVAPLGVYGESKLAGERAVAARCPRHATLRTAWVYGVEGKNFVRTMLRLGRDRDQLRVVADQVGSPTFAGDLAVCCLKLAQRLAEVPEGGDAWGVFHAAGRGSTSWHGLAEAAFEHVGRHAGPRTGPNTGRRPTVDAITTAEYPTPARRPANSVLDCARLARVHGLALRHWRVALAEMLDEVLEREGVEQ
ncbi:MAG: dTDP-4-dehydrorhamnose reductase [Pseudomonadota bacterium]